MAEPLLKRTFSRLRGKDRSRRKTDPKLSDVPVKNDTVLQTPSSSSSSPPMTTTRPPPAADPDPPSPPHNHITVAKKQSWARQGSVAPPSVLPSGSAPRPSDRERPSGTSQDASGQAWSQRLVQDKTEQCGDRVSVSLAWDMTSTPCIPVSSTAVHQEAPEPAGGPPDVPATSVSTKSGQRAYLQSLDRSSRAWVLSSGKIQASDEAYRLQEDSGSNIWYNPIPEEEDAGGPHREEEIWRKRDESGDGGASKIPGDKRAELGRVWVGPAESRSSDCLLEGANPSVSHHTDDITTENTDSQPSDSSPASQKKVGVSGSVIDRLRSPGTVRKLSLKMKKLPELRRKLSLRSSSRALRQGNDSRGGGDESASKNTSSSSALSNQNVISRYHLDSSAPPTRPLRRSSRGRSASKGGYLSDGDSPELLPRQPALPLTTSQETACDVSSFRLYVGSDPQRCSQRVTGLLTVHLMGLEEMKTSRSEDSKEVFLAIQIDGVTRARTALLTLRGSALSLNHAFHLELERARQLRIVVLTPANPQAVCGSKSGTDQGQTSGGPTRNRVCCLGGVSIPPLFKGSRSQQLCVKLEPRGLLYVKLSLQEKWDTQPSTDTSVPSNVFGVELHHLVEKEGSASPVPLLIQKCVAEIERRGLKVVGLYRLCGSAAVKKELRDWFERNSSAVCLSEDLYPDINVITGILKDYLRELPSQLITRTLYQVVREAMTLQPPPSPPATPDPQMAQSTVELLSCLPHPERATLSLLLDHLSLVASFSSSNRMTHQNLAVCFGPVLLTPTQEAWRGGGGGAGRGGRGVGKGFGHGEEIASAVDFKRHIEALHYLLQLWPVPTHRVPADDHIKVSPPPSPALTHNPLLQQQHRKPALRLALPQNPEEVVVSRRGRGGLARLESPPPINRYAGDWSVCGRDLLSGQEADYDEVAGSESDGGSGDEEEEKKEAWSSGGGEGGGLYVDEFLDFDAPFNCRLSLKDFDTLIHDLDRELAKQINICL
ncbi:rho GTPase-activating protein SYDE1 [Micropterus salmoides]|uniref:rho GTPase-activating protein SYDE1 n=1 Tax=Micropterus salmoides TaxID=27706 RepID=UPI0018EBB589|nr:rho GTPase-activating protein SYDE1 [Micropterus salmoides]XP_038591289.1 rho GTPase-activating protein SYDE1 [Micropterus salmoides]